MAQQQQNIYSTLVGGVIMISAFVVSFYLGYLVIEGILVPLIFAIIASVVSDPVYQWFLSKVKNRYLSSFLCCLLLLLIIIASLSLVVYLAVGEVVSVTKVFTSSIDFSGLEVAFDQQQIEQLVNQTIRQVNEFLEGIPFIDADLPQIFVEVLRNVPTFLQNISSYVLSFLRIGLDSATNVLFNLFIFVISYFFLLIDGGKFLQYVFRLLPINSTHEDQIIKRFKNLSFAWIVVNILIAIIQGSLTAVGLYIAGVPSPLIWGVIAIVASFIPFVGAALIWAPIALVYFILGEWTSGLIITIWGLALVSTIDNVLRPFFLNEGVKIHPLIVFLAVLGGFTAFNVPGLIFGPLIVLFISTLLYIYELEFSEVLDGFHKGTRSKKKSSKES